MHWALVRGIHKSASKDYMLWLHCGLRHNVLYQDMLQGRSQRNNNQEKITNDFFKDIIIIIIARWLQGLLHHRIWGLHIKNASNISSLPQGTSNIKIIAPYDSTSLWAIKSTSNQACVGFMTSASHKWPQNGSFGPFGVQCPYHIMSSILAMFFWSGHQPLSCLCLLCH